MLWQLSTIWDHISQVQCPLPTCVYQWCCCWCVWWWIHSHCSVRYLLCVAHVWWVPFFLAIMCLQIQQLYISHYQIKNLCSDELEFLLTFKMNSEFDHYPYALLLVSCIIFRVCKQRQTDSIASPCVYNTLQVHVYQHLNSCIRHIRAHLAVIKIASVLKITIAENIV